MSARSLLAPVLVAALAGPAAADHTGYVGAAVAGGGLGGEVAGEIAVDGGLQVGEDGAIYAHAKLAKGSRGDFEDSVAYTAGLGGVELRTEGSSLRTVLGLDVGVGFVEDDLGGEIEALVSAHAGAEVGLDVLVLRLGVITLDLTPMLTAGLAVQW